MSQTLPQSQLGGIVTKPLVDGFARVEVANREALEILSLTPVDTVWGGPFGRPIYDRLPGVSEGYREEYFGEIGRGLVYIEPQFGTSTGPGSLQVGAWQKDPRVLVVYNGTITWAYGQVPTSTLAINMETVVPGGIQDGSYQVGYYLNRVPPDEVRYSKYSVEDYSLGGSQTVYATDKEARYHPVLSMFSEPSDGSWRPSEFGDAGAYDDGSAVTMDFTETVVAGEFVLVASTPAQATAYCALYSSDDAIVWHLQDSVSPRDGRWVVRSSSSAGARYFRLFFWGGEADVAEVRYTGEALFQNKRPTGAISEAEIFLEGEYDQIDRPHILLAVITVSNYEITSIRDERSQTSRKYEPVASWLTDFQDRSLRKLITDIEGYSELYMSPIGGAYQFYEQLLEENFVLESETKTPVVNFPSAIELEPGWTSLIDPGLETDPLDEGLATNPQGFEIAGENVEIQLSNSAVTPAAVMLLAPPTDAGDMANKAYADIAIVPSLDNGKF